MGPQLGSSCCIFLGRQRAAPGVQGWWELQSTRISEQEGIISQFSQAPPPLPVLVLCLGTGGWQQGPRGSYIPGRWCKPLPAEWAPDGQESGQDKGSGLTAE